MLLWVTWSLPMLVGLGIIKLSHSPGHSIDCSAFGSYDSAHLMGSEMPLAHRDILWGTNKPQQKKGQTGERSCLPLPVTVLHLKSSLWFASGPRLRVNTWTQATKSHAQRHSNIPSAVGAGVPGSRAKDLEGTSVRKSRWRGAPAVSPSFPQPYTYGLAAISLWPVSGGGRRSSRPGFWLSSYCTQALCEVNDNYIPLRHGPEWQWWRKTFPMGRTPGQTTGLSTLCGMKGDLWYGSTLTHGQWLMGWLTGRGLVSTRLENWWSEVSGE